MIVHVIRRRIILTLEPLAPIIFTLWIFYYILNFFLLYFFNINF